MKVNINKGKPRVEFEPHDTLYTTFNTEAGRLYLMLEVVVPHVSQKDHCWVKVVETKMQWKKKGVYIGKRDLEHTTGTVGCQSARPARRR